MEETTSSSRDERVKWEALQLTALLKEMKEDLEALRSKVQALTAKVKANNFQTADGISYLEAKHLLLLSYCQSLVYYLLRKARGFSIEGHPVVQTLVEIRLFLEKIRPIDKKLQYQIQKLTSISGSITGADQVGASTEESNTTQRMEDLLENRPYPDISRSKSDMTSEDGTGVYRARKFAPTSMDEDKFTRQARNASRKDKETLRQARQSDYLRQLMDDLEGRPEEVKEIVGTESRELTRYKSQLDVRFRREEELFTRAPMTKMEKKKEKHLKKSRNGLLGLTDSFYDEIKTLPLEDNFGEQSTAFTGGDSRMGKLKKRKRKH